MRKPNVAFRFASEYKSNRIDLFLSKKQQVTRPVGVRFTNEVKSDSCPSTSNVIGRPPKAIFIPQTDLSLVISATVATGSVRKLVI